MVMLPSSCAMRAALKATSLIICLSLVACRSEPGTPPGVLEALEAEQHANHIVIGYLDGEALEYVDSTSGNAFRHVFMAIKPTSVRSIDLRSGSGVKESSDGKWIASCGDRSNCTVSEKDEPGMRFSVSRGDALTSLEWSPDDRIVFWVKKGPPGGFRLGAPWRMSGIS
jgi:hypothetical protein